MPSRTSRRERVPERAPISAASLPRLRRAGRAIVLAAMVLGPLLVLPPGVLLYNAPETPRRSALLLAAGLLAGLILLSWAARRRFTLRWHALDGAVLLFALAAVVTGLVGEFPLISFFAPLWAQDSLALLGIGVLLYLGVKEFLREPAEQDQAAALMVLVGGLVAAIGLCDFFLGWNLNPALAGKRLVATLGNSMFTGTYFAVLIPLGVGTALAMTSPRGRAVMLGAVGLMGVALLYTQARAAWVGLALAILLTLVVAAAYRRALGRFALPAVAGTVLVGLALIGFALSQPRLRARLYSTVNLDDATMRTRKVYMRASLNLFLAHPLQGWGAGNLKFVFPQHRPSSGVIEQNLPINRGYSTALPHNLPLQIAAETGLLGLIPFAILLFLLYRTGFRLLHAAERPWLVVGLLGMLSAYLFANLFAFDDAATATAFWMGLGLLAALGAQDRPLPETLGELSRPLTARAARMLRAGGLIIMVGSGLYSVQQMTAAALMQRGADLGNQAASSFPGDIPASFLAAKAAVGAFDSANQMAPVPYFESYRELMKAHRLRMLMAQFLIPQYRRMGGAQQVEDLTRIEQEAWQGMRRSGESALRLMDRDPMALRLLAEQYGRHRMFKDAHRLTAKLRSYEPNSAEVNLYEADILAAEGKYDEAMRRALLATRLDPTFGDAFAMLAHYENELVAHGDPRVELVYQVCEHYARAEKLGLALNPEHRLEYATALFLTRRNERAVEQGRKLQGTPLFADLLDKVEIIYKRYKEPAIGKELIQRLTEGMPSAPAPPTPAG